MIDELDAFIGKTKDAMNIILDIPLYAPKTTLIGIANSLGFYSKISHYYSKFPAHKTEELVFEAYTFGQIESIITKKLKSQFSNTERMIKKDALHHLSAKAASISGDIRAAFDVLKTAFQDHLARFNESAITMKEITDILNTKYRSKVAKILNGLPREHQMIAAAIYIKFKKEGKEFYKYDEVYAKTVSITGQLGLPRAAFSEFCESVKMLEFYGVLKGLLNAKSIYASKVRYACI